MKKPKAWYDKDCRLLRRDVNKLCRELQKSPFNRQLRAKYFITLKSYKKALKKKKKCYVNNLVNTIMNASRNDPKLYWNTLKRLRDTDKDEKSSEIPPEDWFDHFKNLNTKPAESDGKYDDVSDFTRVETFSELDFKITSSELLYSLKLLKGGKATGLDGISNEMLKHCNNDMIQVILKLFNVILQTSFYPQEWSKGRISTIFKSGDKYVCDNYRGITITSCLGKLFATVLNQRLLKYSIDKKLIPENQIGFMPQARTSDHVFVLKCAIEKYLRKKKQLFACFIDFRKAFDSVSHDALFLKLQQVGIGGLFHRVIKQMYQSTELCVRTPNGLTPFFKSNIGVRQGCALSPLLFNIFLSDLPAWLDSGDNKPICLFSKKISHLLYADDLVLLSETEEGLQKYLDSLNGYCLKWSLSINVHKSKVMVFSKSKKNTTYDFKVGNQSIETVQNYKYLGIIFSSDGSFQQAKIHLEKKASRALFGMHSYINGYDLPIPTCLDLFDRLIKPIACYGVEVWFPSCLNLQSVFKGKSSIFDKCLDFPGSKLHMKFCKRLLKVHEKSVNFAVLGELGHIPPIISILTQLVNFWIHILHSPTDSILYDAYICSYNIYYESSKYSSYNNKWFQLIHYLARSFPYLQSFWENHDSTLLNQRTVSRILNNFKFDLINAFESFWIDEISRMSSENPGGRLHIFSNIKSIFETERYLTDIKNPLHRRIYSQFRISAHKLGIETGRYLKIPREKRLCMFCKNVYGDFIDNELHFLLHCPKHATNRKILFNFIVSVFPEFSSLGDFDKVIFLLSNPQVSSKVAYFLFENSKVP